MKKSLYAILVILLSAIGANALASMLDVSVHKVTIETNDKGSGPNGSSDNTGTRNAVTREK